MKSKKLILLLAIVLLLSLATPAYAANPKTRVTAKVALPDVKIEVVVPSGTKAYINPQRIPVKIGGKIEDSMIFSDEAHIENKSVVPVKVTASVTGSVKTGSDLSLSSTAFDTAAITAKKAFLYLDMQAVSNPDSVQWVDEYDAEKHVIVTSSTKTKKDIVTLAAGDENAAENGPRYGAFRLTGICTDSPKNDWNAKDGVNVQISFTFTALPASTVVE